ncbi:urease accessory protein [Streptosporangium album]|uniref:Urease accessory protein UreF n=1 Tax=Streptosporangium album TaxID=47479 RepID=A0A7W7RZK6_9ACTN|nr:urease accessory UreF family protein [Streptosporangium album]MBB4940837.1 urease accessory protein [Streptosporangium album]
MRAALLLLADSRLPAGGHGHSGGAEEAVRTGAVHDLPSLDSFLRGRLATAGLVAAALAAAACEFGTVCAGDRLSPSPARHPGAGGTEEGDGWTPAGRTGSWARLDAEADARTASPAQREAGRTQGRLLLRTARRIWPSPVLDDLAGAVPQGTHHPIALGAAAAAAGCAPGEAALAAAYTAVTGPATAAVRLLGLDPVPVHRLLADLTQQMERIAAGAPAGWESLPAHAAPALDLLAEGHVRAELRLFVS